MSPAPPHRLPHNVEGALWMLASAVTFVGMTTLVKALSDYPASLQNLYRQGVALVLVLPFVLRAPRRIMGTSRLGVVLFRAVCGTLGTILMFYSYHLLPMAAANALSFTRPLFVSLLAAVVLREVLGPHRIGAVLVGFVGVLILLRPGEEGLALGLPQAAALGSAVLLALSITGMKTLTRDLPPLGVLAWSALLGSLLSLPMALAEWRWPDPADLGLLVLMASMGMVNQLFFIRGMAVGDAAAMAPLDYSRLVLSVASGWLLFAEAPDPMTLAGAGIIVAATLYITYREARIARQARAAARMSS